MMEFLPDQYFVTMPEHLQPHYLYMGWISTDLHFYAMTEIKSREMHLFHGKTCKIIARGEAVKEMVNRGDKPVH